MEKHWFYLQMGRLKVCGVSEHLENWDGESVHLSPNFDLIKIRRSIPFPIVWLGSMHACHPVPTLPQLEQHNPSTAPILHQIVVVIVTMAATVPTRFSIVASSRSHVKMN